MSSIHVIYSNFRLAQHSFQFLNLPLMHLIQKQTVNQTLFYTNNKRELMFNVTYLETSTQQSALVNEKDLQKCLYNQSP